MTRRSCDELGVCQGSGACHCEGETTHHLDTLPPGGFWFALKTPGEAVLVYALGFFSLELFLVLLGLSLGYIKLPGWLG